LVVAPLTKGSLRDLAVGGSVAADPFAFHETNVARYGTNTLPIGLPTPVARS
jgi:hypothetical protein